LLRKSVVLCIIIIGLCARTQAKSPAGIVLYFKSGDDIFLLLADHRESKRGWAAYGGGSDEGESVAQTAARETEEETRGYFPRNYLLGLIESKDPVVDQDGFAMYFAEIPFVPAQLVTNNPLPSDDDVYVERGPYAWIPYSQVRKYVEGSVDYKRKHPIEAGLMPAGNYTSWFWPIWLGSFRRAAESDALPWNTER